MTISNLIQIIEEYKIPKDTKLLSDSGWECGATNMDGIYYNKNRKEIVFTQTGSKHDRYYKNDEWQLLHGETI